MDCNQGKQESKSGANASKTPVEAHPFDPPKPVRTLSYVEDVDDEDEGLSSSSSYKQHPPSSRAHHQGRAFGGPQSVVLGDVQEESENELADSKPDTQLPEQPESRGGHTDSRSDHNGGGLGERTPTPTSLSSGGYDSEPGGARLGHGRNRVTQQIESEIRSPRRQSPEAESWGRQAAAPESISLTDDQEPDLLLDKAGGSWPGQEGTAAAAQRSSAEASRSMHSASPAGAVRRKTLYSGRSSDRGSRSTTTMRHLRDSSRDRSIQGQPTAGDRPENDEHVSQPKRHDNPPGGVTRFMRDFVDAEVLDNLGYSYQREDDHFVVQTALTAEEYVDVYRRTVKAREKSKSKTRLPHETRETIDAATEEPIPASPITTAAGATEHYKLPNEGPDRVLLPDQYAVEHRPRLQRRFSSLTSYYDSEPILDSDLESGSGSDYHDSRQRTRHHGSIQPFQYALPRPGQRHESQGPRRPRRPNGRRTMQPDADFTDGQWYSYGPAESHHHDHDYSSSTFTDKHRHSINGKPSLKTPIADASSCHPRPPLDIPLGQVSVTVPVASHVLRTFTTSFDAEMPGGLPLGEKWSRDAWSSSRTEETSHGMSTRLFTIFALEYLGDTKARNQCESIALMCPPISSHQQPDKESVQLRWLHVSGQAPSLRYLENLVHSCPHVSPRLKSLATILLRDVRDRFKHPCNDGYIIPGAVLRYIGSHCEDPAKHTEPIFFALAPEVILQNVHGHTRDPKSVQYTTRELLHFLHGYRVSARRERSQAVAGFTKQKGQALHVSQTWCILLGHKTLITFGKTPVEELKGENIRIIEQLQTPRGPLTVRVDVPARQSLFMVVRHDCSFAKFLSTVWHHAGLGSESENWHLYLWEKDRKGRGLTPEAWLLLFETSARRELRLVLEREKTVVWTRTDAGDYTQVISDPQDRKPVRPLASRELDVALPRNSTPPHKGEKRSYRDIKSHSVPSETAAMLGTKGLVINDPSLLVGRPIVCDLESGDSDDSLVDEEPAGKSFDTDDHADEAMTGGVPSQQPRTTGVLQKYHDLEAPRNPFLTWTVRQGDAGDESRDSVVDKREQQVEKLLRHMVKSRPRHHWVDSTGGYAWQCSFKEVDIAVGLRPPEANSKHRRSATSKSHHRTPTQGYKLGNRFGPLLRDLVAAAKKLISMFVPADMDLDGQDVISTVGGALDRIIRNVHHALHVPVPRYRSDQSWDILMPEDERCMCCERHSLARSALEHLHTHTRCRSLAVVDYILNEADDPCYPQIRPLHELDDAQTGADLDRTHNSVSSLLHELRLLTSRAIWLHLTVKSPDAADHAVPMLPQSLVAAFGSIVDYITLSAQKIADMANPDSRRWHSDRSKLDASVRRAWSEALAYITTAQSDIIIMQTTLQPSMSASMQAVGPEMLLSALLSNIESQRLPLKTSLTPVELYQRHITRLQSQAYDKAANRRVLISLRAGVRSLQEELRALELVNVTFQQIWDSLAKVLDPASFQITTVARVSLWQGVEESYVTSHRRLLLARKDELAHLIRRAAWLKEEIRQSIDVLEEEHGKAIRVFTIVTLFFLPLSFVASVFGMNTADVRDMDSDQTAFWAVSIPATAAVVALAFLYGYKMDGLVATVRGGSHQNESMDEDEDELDDNQI